MVLLGERANDAARIAVCQHTGGNVFGDNASGTNDAAASDGHTGENRDITAEPNVITQCDWLRALQSLIALIRKQRMNGGIHAAVRTDKTMRTDGDGRAVHQMCAVIEKGILSNRAVVPVIGIKWRENHGGLSELWHQCAKKLLAFLCLIGWRVVELEAQHICVFALL